MTVSLYINDVAVTGMVGVLGVLMVFYLMILAVGILGYVLTGIGLSTAAKRWGIAHPWLSWLPVGNVWIMCALGDECHRRESGKDSKLRVWTIWLYVAFIVLYICSLIVSIVGALGFEYSSEAALAVALMIAGLGMMVAFGAIIAVAVLEYMCLYRYFKGASPENAVMYLVLSIVFGVTLPFFLFYLRNKGDAQPQVNPTEEEPQVTVLE